LLPVYLAHDPKTEARRGGIPSRAMASNDVLLTVSPASGGSDALTAQGLTLFATTILARFLVALFELQALEQAIVLNFFLQNAHGFFKIVVENFDFNCFQTDSTPLCPIAAAGGLVMSNHDG
jgi:hypothetical protein